jgi:hypothetical protein
LAPFYFASPVHFYAAAARSAPIGARRKCRDGLVPEYRAAAESHENEAVEAVLVFKREFHMPTRVNTKISTGQQSLAL